MLKTLCRFAAALLAAAAFALPARATTYSTDYTDLWYNPNESGWGLNLIQQGQTMFGTLFVYGVGNVPQWFVASDIEPVGTSTTQFTGQLYQTSGPYFGAGSFDQAAVQHVTVGTITLTFTDINTATLVYTVNGQQVTKTVTRQTWRNDNLSGNYGGGLLGTGSNCGNGVSNGAVSIFGNLAVQHPSNNQISMTVQFQANAGASQCTFAGTYTQHGRTGSIAGNFNCTVPNQQGNTGTFTISSIDSSPDGFMGHFNGRDQFCTYDGPFGGVRDLFQ